VIAYAGSGMEKLFICLFDGVHSVEILLEE
jgi:hypothetical protein